MPELKMYLVEFRAIFPSGCYSVILLCSAENEEEVDKTVRESYTMYFNQKLIRGYSIGEITVKGIVVDTANTSVFENSFWEAMKDKEFLNLYHQDESGEWVVSTAKEMLAKPAKAGVG